jgi:hypothetical protein
MSKVTVFRFRLYDPTYDTMVLSSRWGTRAAIERYDRSLVIDGTAAEVDAGCVKTDLPGFTVSGFDPSRRLLDGFPVDGFPSFAELNDVHAHGLGLV